MPAPAVLSSELLGDATHVYWYVPDPKFKSQCYQLMHQICPREARHVLNKYHGHAACAEGLRLEELTCNTFQQWSSYDLAKKLPIQLESIVVSEIYNVAKV